MQDSRKTKAQLIDELAALRQRVAELERQPSPALDRSTPAPDPYAEPLKLSEPYVRSVLAALPEAIVITGLFGQITFANEQAARLHGFVTPGDMSALSVYSLIAPRQQTKVIEMVRQSVLGRAINNIETELVRQDGTTFWAELTVTSLCDAQGSPTAVVGITRDITTRRELAEALQASEAQFRAVVEDQTELICRFRPDGVLTFVNDAYCRAFGKTRADLIGDNFMPMIPEEDHAIIAHEMARLTPQSPVVTYEHRVILTDGDVRWQQWTDRALYNMAGELIEYQSVGRDVTARQQIEQELMDTKAMLEAAINQSPVPMALLSAPDGMHQIVNPALREYLGIQTEPSWAGLTLDQLERSWVNLDRQGVPVPADQSPAALALRGIGTYNLEGGVRQKNGSLRSDLTSAVPIFNSRGQQIAAFVVVIDITDRKQLEEALHTSERRLQMALHAAQAGAWEYNRRTNQAIWSDGNYRVLGYEPGSGEASIESWLTAVHPDDRAAASANLMKMIEQQRDLDFEFRVAWPDQSVHWLRVVGHVAYDDQGAPLELVGLQIDITESKKLAEALATSEEQYRLLAQNLPGTTIILFDHNLRYTLVEGEIPPYFGSSKEQMLGKTLWEVLPRDSAERFADVYRAALNSGAQTDMSVQYEDRHFTVSVVPIRNPHGEVVAGMLVARDITAVQKSEEALRASEERYRTLIDNQGEGMGLVDANEFFVFANPAAEDLFGQPGGLVGHNLSEFVEADQFALIKHETLRRQQGQKSTYEITVLRPDGQVRNLIITAVPQLGALGEFLGTFGVFRDITARKQVEAEVRRLNAELEQRVIERTTELAALNAALQDDIHHRQRIEDMLRRSEQRYRTLFESAADAIFIFNLNGQFIEANRVAGERYGYTLDELRQLSVMNLAPAEQQEFIPARLEQTRHQGFNRFETVHQRRDGALIPVDVNSRVIEYGGQPAILSIIRDITDRKQTEQTLRRYNTEQTALYNTALLLNAQLDVAALLRLIIEQAAALLGVSAGGVCLYDEGRDTLVLAVGLDLYAKYVGVEIKPGEGLSGQAFQQRAVLMPDGSQTWNGQLSADNHEEHIRAAIAAPLLAKQIPLGVLFVASDQHKQRFDDHDQQLVELFAAQAATALENARLYARQQEQYRRLQEAQTRLIHAEKMSALGQLIASISHEINNPLQAVQGCLTLVREGIAETVQLDPTVTTNWQRDLSVAAAEVQRIANIVQRLRDFYRPARAGLQTVDVAAAIDTVLALAAKQLQHCGITVERSATANPPLTVTTNADQLKQILLNLVLNAIDAMPNGGQLQVVAKPDTLPRPSGTQPAVRIDLTDTGHGMTPDTVTRIFEPFFTTKESGSGLGLAISYELVTSLGGEINVTSEVGVGTTFSIQLPVHVGEDDAEVAA